MDGLMSAKCKGFQYHYLCEKQRIVNLCFANDLFLFARGHPKSVRVIMDALEEFKNVLGLVLSILKRTTFFCNVLNPLKANILSYMVSDLISNGSWRWPHDWSSRFSNVVNIPVPYINNYLDDVIVWRDVQGEKLKTQDRLRQWDVGPSIDLNLLRCPLCDMVIDSHSHLFFECSFASQVWFQVHAFTGMSSVPSRFVDVLIFLIPTKGSSVSNFLSRIVLAALTYWLWNEQNSRFFKKKKSNANQIVLLITSLWKIPSSCFDQDGSSRYRYIKNHKKTVKNGQARTREQKSAQKPEAKQRKVKTSVKQSKESQTMVNRNQP
ncbi:reverse transcriptase domain, reverse transcriptase zinc-binding domain protein [Tanacetum coccineum]